MEEIKLEALADKKGGKLTINAVNLQERSYK